jgi:uncharacterized damage-inducible protein DinB
MSVQQLLDEITGNRAELLAAITGLDEETLDRKGVVGEWSIKNVLAHLTGWEAWLIDVMPEALASGVTPERAQRALREMDAWNAEQVTEREEYTPDEQLTELERTRDELIARLRTLDDAVLEQEQAWFGRPHPVAEYIRICTSHHDDEHREALSAATGERVKG